VRKRLLAFALSAVALIAAGSRFLSAHQHPSRNTVWPRHHPIHYEQPEIDRIDPAVDRTFLVKPVRVDLDQEAPGPYGVRAVRLHLRGLQDPGTEHTVSWFRESFSSETDMAEFHRMLSRYMRAPILSMRVRVVADPSSPRWNTRWRAVGFPYWIEIPYH